MYNIDYCTQIVLHIDVFMRAVGRIAYAYVCSTYKVAQLTDVPTPASHASLLQPACARWWVLDLLQHGVASKRTAVLVLKMGLGNRSSLSTSTETTRLPR